MGVMHDILSAALNLSGARPSLRDAGAVRQQIDGIVRLAVFGSVEEQALARYAIHAAAPELGAVPVSYTHLTLPTT